MGKKQDSKKRKKQQTESGRFRAQTSYYDDMGKRRVKSFTADTLEEAKYLAMLWKKDNNNRSRLVRIRVADAVEKYIDMKRAVLSPSTIRSYVNTAAAHIDNEPVGNIYVHELTTAPVQLWISSLASVYSPKTVRNTYALLKSAVEMFEPDKHFKVTLPQKEKLEYYCPSDADIAKLLDQIRFKYGPASDLEIAVMLAAFGTLRRGEICALTSDDVSGNRIHVSKSMVRDEWGVWTVKGTKTYSSNRIVDLPGFVIDMISNKSGRIVDIQPDKLSFRFKDCVTNAGLPAFRFHDLRHYSASIMHAIGVPDQYIMDRGGWASDNVMKSVYRNVIDIEKSRQTKKINDYFAVKFS